MNSERLSHPSTEHRKEYEIERKRPLPKKLGQLADHGSHRQTALLRGVITGYIGAFDINMLPQVSTRYTIDSHSIEKAALNHDCFKSFATMQDPSVEKCQKSMMRCLLIVTS